MNKHKIDMTEGRMLPKLLRFILPLMLATALQLAFITPASGKRFPRR